MVRNLVITYNCHFEPHLRELSVIDMARLLAKSARRNDITDLWVITSALSVCPIQSPAAECRA